MSIFVFSINDVTPIVIEHWLPQLDLLMHLMLVLCHWNDIQFDENLLDNSTKRTTRWLTCHLDDSHIDDNNDFLIKCKAIKECDFNQSFCSCIIESWAVGSMTDDLTSFELLNLVSSVEKCAFGLSDHRVKGKGSVSNYRFLAVLSIWSL